ncbi:MAG: hypothetical protein J1E06_05845 [Acutalibacter sp.]|nr:hypothetical protein [Acutalibacter sp.]
MIHFDKYYSFSAEEVELIETGTNTENSRFPFVLTVTLKSGRKMSINYTTDKDRETAKRTIEFSIERALHQESDKLYSKLILIESAVNRIDKRQLRIWRQLKALLRLSESEEEAE